MSHSKNPTILTELDSISINDLLPERPAIIGEFSPAYEAFRVATLSDLAPVTQYEFLQAQQLVDLNQSILQLKASSDVELSTSMERNMGRLIDNKLEGNAESESRRQLNQYLEAGGDEDEFEDNVDWAGMDAQRDGIVEGLKSTDPDLRGQAFVEANALGVDPRLVLSVQLLKNVNYRRHIDKLPDLEKRARLLSAEYREIQKARPIEVVPVSEIQPMVHSATGPRTPEGKAVSSQNALRHGLNTAPDNDLVFSWFNVFLNNERDAYEELNTDGLRREAALMLAVAEVRYHRVLHHRGTRDVEQSSMLQFAHKLRKEIYATLEAMPQTLKDGLADPIELEYVSIANQKLEEILDELRRERRLQDRYLGEARAQRKRALKVWRNLSDRENKNSRNEPNYNQ